MVRSREFFTKSNKFNAVLLIIALILILISFYLEGTISTIADSEGTEQNYEDPVKIRCTCYKATGNKCASGRWPVEGLTVAGKREWMGKTAILYRVNEDGSIGDFIGYYEFMDTGGYYIRTGKRIDVYRDTLQGCYDWIDKYGDYVYLQIIDSEG